MMKIGFLFLITTLLLSVSQEAISYFKTFHFKGENAIVSEGTKLESYLKTGQVVATESSDPVNIIYLLLYPKFSPLVHGGIVSKENGRFFVYEAAGDYKVSLSSKPPTDSIHGEVRRTPLMEFIHQGRTVNIYQGLSGNIAQSHEAIAWAKEQWKKRVPFDAYFNYQDHSSLYCAEFLALTLEKGSGSRYKPVHTRTNTSLKVLLSWLKVRDTSIMPLYQLVSPSGWVGTISLDYKKKELEVDRLVKHNIFERFTSTQKIGNILFWSRTKVGFRTNIKSFYQLAAQEAKKAHSNSSLERAVNDIANKIFGKFHVRKPNQCFIYPVSCTN